MRRCLVFALLFVGCRRPQTTASDAGAAPAPSASIATSDVVDFGPPGTPDDFDPPTSIAAIAPTKASTMTPIPKGKVKKISMGNGHGCAILSDDTLACWSEPKPLFELGTVPKGRFTDVEVGGWSTCAHAMDGKLTCFGSPRIVPHAPEGAAVRMCHDDGPCVELADGTATCYHDDKTMAHGEIVSEQKTLSLGPILPGSLSCGASYACALTTGSLLKCVEMDRVMAHGSKYAAPADWHPPTTPLKRVFSGYQHGCALKPDDTATCWGRDVSGETRPPRGAFTTLAVGEKLSCGLRPTGDIECWGSRPGGPWKGPFKAVAPSTHHDRDITLCAIKSDDTVACWPYEG